MSRKMPSVEVKDYTSVFTQPIFKNQNGEWYRDVGYADSLDLIRENVQRAAKSFIAIGYYLKHIKEKELFKEGGYPNIWECAEREFGLSQSAASRYMNMNDTFSINGNTPVLDGKYIDFNKSQLQEMLMLPSERRDEIKPDQSVSEIRQIAKLVKNNLKEKAVKEPEEKEIILFYELYVKSMDDKKRENLPDRLKERYRNAFGSGGRVEYSGSARGIKINKADEITWSHIVRLINKFIPVPAAPAESEAQLPGQMDVSDYPGIVPIQSEIMPDQPEEIIVEAEEIQNVEESDYKEIEVAFHAAEQPQHQLTARLPILKNNEQRKEWIEAYKVWGLWYRDENIDVNYYKYDLPDGSRLIAVEYPKRQSYWVDKEEDEVYYHLLEKKKKKYGRNAYYEEQYRNSASSITEIVDFLKNIQKVN